MSFCLRFDHAFWVFDLGDVADPAVNDSGLFFDREEVRPGFDPVGREVGLAAFLDRLDTAAGFFELSITSSSVSVLLLLAEVAFVSPSSAALRLS